MPLTFTAPIEEIPRPIDLTTLQSPDLNWSPPITKMTAEQAATLKGLAEAAYELDAFKPKLTSAEADQRIAGRLATPGGGWPGMLWQQFRQGNQCRVLLSVSR